MRIVVLGPTGYPGGLQTHYFELVGFLKSIGHEVLAVDVSLKNQKSADKPRSNNRLKIRSAQGWKSKFFSLFDWLFAIHKARIFRPELCIAVANGNGYALMAKSLPKSCYSLRTEVTSDYAHLDALRLKMARSFSATIVQSEGLINAHRLKIGSNFPLAVLPCFSSQMSCGTLAKKPVDGQDIRIAFFGRLAPNKGICEIIDAIQLLSESQRPILDIWGSGSLSEAITERIRIHSLERFVRLRGSYPTGHDYEKLLASYHGLVLPSQYSEGLPLVLLEASSVGLPFLSTNIGAISDCSNNNPDVFIIETGKDELALGLKSWLLKLSEGVYDPSRLQNWYVQNHSRFAQEAIWQLMLKNPGEFIENYSISV